MNATPRAIYVAIALVGADLLLLQIVFTRLMSVTASYHAAFAAIALVMTGLAASATAVYVRNATKPAPTLAEAADKLSLAAVWLVGGTFAFLLLGALPLGALASGVTVLAAFALFFVGFWLTGWAVAFLLAAYHRDVGRVYWSDLTGASVGCLLAVPVLDTLSAQNAVLACGAVAGVAAMLLASVEGGPAVRRARGATALAVVATLLGVAFPPLTALRTAKGQDQSDNKWVKWNHLARVSVVDEIPGADRAIARIRQSQPDVDAEALVARWQMGWGISPTYAEDEASGSEMLWVQLDTDAGTQIIPNGPSRLGVDLPHIEADVTTAAHHLKRDDIERAFVIGGGGGRDILTALHFGADEVHVAELNPDVVRAVDEAFSDYSGSPYSLPEVSLTLGDGRSTLDRSPHDYDVIQISMIDTWASSMAGAMVLSENGLYTIEAYDLYLDHLTQDGMLTVSRWYHPEQYGETARVVTLMAEALKRRGVERPEQHIALMYAGSLYGMNVATVLMKASPFTEAELAKLDAWCTRLRFHRLWPDPEPTPADIMPVAGLAAGDPAAIAANPFDLAPPNDNRPFFFSVHRPFRSWLDAASTGDLSKGSPSSARIFGLLLILMLVARVLVWSPLAEHEAKLPESERTHLSDHWGPVLYFAGIGFGFMWVEVAVIQRYIVFLGHPTYALSVVLFGLLLFGGFGSALSARMDVDRWPAAIGSVLLGVVATALLVPIITASAMSLTTTGRIALAIGLIAPLGLCMGMIYPLGIRLLDRAGIAHLVPWVWAVNGLCGVFASVAGMLVAIAYGYTAVLLLGAACYVLTGASVRLLPWGAARSEAASTASG